MTWKKVECPFEKDRKILQYMLTAPAFNEDGTFTNDGMNDVRRFRDVRWFNI